MVQHGLLFSLVGLGLRVTVVIKKKDSSSASCSKELYNVTKNIHARKKQVQLPTMYPLSYLVELFSNYFSETIMKI